MRASVRLFVNNMKSLSIIIPVLNEQENIRGLLKLLQPARGDGAELIVVDGGSSDLSCEYAESLCDHLVHSERGRARQMNAGAAVASGKLLWFLHADSIPSDAALDRLRKICDSGENVWGRFDISLSGSHFLLKIVAFMMNIRSGVTGIATGDQGIFMHRNLFEKIKGFPDLLLMEDISMCSELKKIRMPLCCREKLVTSSRRWEEKGIWRTIMLMWWIRLSYATGRDPKKLHQQYYS